MLSSTIFKYSPKANSKMQCFALHWADEERGWGPGEGGTGWMGPVNNRLSNRNPVSYFFLSCFLYFVYLYLFNSFC